MVSADLSLFSHDDNDARKDKAPNALRTISEAADQLDVPQHVLRFWETKFPQIKPLKRNGGRRFYRPQDLDILQQIKHLLYNQGYTIKGAKKAVDDFIHAKGERAVSTNEWIASIPPANVNDNFVAEHADVLSEIAEALAEPVDVVKAQLSPLPQAFPRDELYALRDELVAIRNKLHTKLRAEAA